MPRSIDTDPCLPGVILAAGASRRFPTGNKLLMPINGCPLLTHAVNTCLQARYVHPVFVVLGYQAERVEAALRDHVNDADVTILINETWQAGLSTSLRTAIAALPEDAPGVLVLPGDMPFMTADLIDRVAETSLRTDRICFPTVGTRKGHPTAFPRRFLDRLTETSGDTGARKVVRAHWDASERLALSSTEAITQRDVDTAEQYRRFVP